VEIGADLGGHTGLFLSVAYLLVSVLATRDQTGLVARFTTVGAHLSPQRLDWTADHRGPGWNWPVWWCWSALARVPEPLGAVGSLTPWKWRTRLSSSARGGDFERWDHCSQITSERLDPTPACVRCPRTTSANRRKVRNRDLVTNADLQRSRTNAATGETKSCNAKMESVTASAQ
jgi:hypothetical protein